MASGCVTLSETVSITEVNADHCFYVSVPVRDGVEALKQSDPDSRMIFPGRLATVAGCLGTASLSTPQDGSIAGPLMVEMTAPGC